MFKNYPEWSEELKKKIRKQQEGSRTFIKVENNAKSLVEAICKISVATGSRGVTELKFSYLGCWKSD